MGCWNATCFVSRLPILAGDPVRWFLIADYRGDDSGLGMPLSIGYPGVYNNYGAPFDLVGPASDPKKPQDPLALPDVRLGRRRLGEHNGSQQQNFAEAAGVLGAALKLARAKQEEFENDG